MAFEFAAGKLLGDIVVGVLGNLAYDASGQVARGFARQVTSLLAAADGQRNDELLRALRYAEAEALAAVCDLWLAGQGIPEALLQRQLGRRLVGCTGWLWRPHDRAIDRCIELWRSAAKLARSLPKADGDQLDRLGVTELGNVTELLAAANELGPIPGPVLKQRLLDAYWSHLDSQHFLPPGFEKYLRDRWFELLGHSFRSYLTHHPVARAAFQNDALTRLLQQSGRDEALADLCAQLRRLNEGEEAAADERTKTAAAIGSALDSLLADVSILRAENATDHGRLSTEHQEIKDILLGVAPTPVKAVLPRPPRADLFLQRDGEVAATVNAVLADPPGWVAVLGEGGIGKTSVAAAALCDERVVARYGETRYFVDLSLVTDSDTLLPTVLAACGLATSGAHMGHLTRFLGDDPSLLVLDNAETPWRTGSTAFNDLLTALDAVPRLAVICTLRLNHSPGDPSHREWTTVEPPALTNEAALALVGGLAPKHRGHRALADMVAQLDGMPLALTLLGAAAAREPDMSALERRWQTERTRLLRRDDGQHRLTSLDVSVALSLSSPLLDDLAREVLAAVAWLPAGTSSEDLRLLWPEHGAAACDSLREQALLRPAAHRLDLLNPVRESLRRQLPLGDVAKASLAVHYAELIAASPVLGRPGGAQALARLLPEAPNIEAALQVLLALHPVADCWDALHGFAQLARFAGAGSVAPLSAAAAAAASARDAEEEAWCRWLIAEVQYMRAELAAATENYEISLTLFVGEEHVLGQANCTRGLANIAMARGEFDHARRLLHKASELSSRSKDSLGLANCIRSLGDIALRDEDLPLAAQRYDDAQRLFEQVDDSLGRANCIERRGQVALLQRDVGPAADLFALAGPVYEQIGHLAGQAQCHLGVGAVAFGRREYEIGRAHV